jgi:hypothetical protein
MTFWRSMVSTSQYTPQKREDKKPLSRYVERKREVTNKKLKIFLNQYNFVNNLHKFVLDKHP